MNNLARANGRRVEAVLLELAGIGRYLRRLKISILCLFSLREHTEVASNQRCAKGADRHPERMLLFFLQCSAFFFSCFVGLLLLSKGGKGENQSIEIISSTARRNTNV